MDLWDALVTDAGLSRLAALENLQYLRIYSGTAHDLPREERGSYFDYGWRRFRRVEPSISDAGLAHLAKARQLKELELYGHQMRGDGLVHFAAMSDWWWETWRRAGASPPI
ncbi:MAG TPA: hypothetical protein VFI31_02475 [Pirellulales bacterium]|nr:hypothetical protein [Pirellulales bacterium]